MALKLSKAVKSFFRKKHPFPGGEAGQSLMEILAVLGILGFVLSLGGALIVASLQASKRAQVQTTAGRLAAEEMESASALASSDWHKIYCPPDGSGSGTCSSQKGSSNVFFATSTLVGYWPMDELSGTAVADVSGSGNNGTTAAATSTGYSYTARTFNGTSDYVSATSSNNSLSIGTSVTLEAWVYPNTVVANYQTFIAKRDSSGANYALRTGTGANANQVEFYYYGGGGWQIYTTSNAGLATSTWVHLAATFSFGSGGTIEIYKNGTLLSGSWTLGNGNAAAALNVVPVTLGDNGNSAEYFNGILDEVRIFNRALPQYEIMQHYLHPKDVIVKTLTAGSEILTFSGSNYTRYFTVDNVSRDPATGAVETSYNAAHDDPSTQKLTVSVSAAYYFSTSTLVQLATRYKNNVFFQTDWSCGAGIVGPTTSQPCGYDSKDSNLSAGVSLSLASGASGSATSTIYDTQISGGAAYNSLEWLGSAGTGSWDVKFQIASSNCSNGATDYPTCATDATWANKFKGPTSSSDYYQPASFNTWLNINGANGTYSDHNNKRYFRYKIWLETNTASPTVTGVYLSWSP